MNLTDFSAVIFDMDGLVLDTEFTYCIAKQQAAQAMGYQFSEMFWQSLSGLHALDIEQKLLSHGGEEFDLAEFDALSVRMWWNYVHDHGIQTKHGFHQLLDYILEQSLPYCLATNSNAANAAHCLKLAGLQEIFPVVITRDDVRRGKPEPDIFWAAAQALNVDIKRCLVLEDSHAGIVAASRAGAFTVLVPSLEPADSLTLSLCDMKMTDLQQLLETMRA